MGTGHKKQSDLEIEKRPASDVELELAMAEADQIIAAANVARSNIPKAPKISRVEWLQARANESQKKPGLSSDS